MNTVMQRHPKETVDIGEVLASKEETLAFIKRDLPPASRYYLIYLTAYQLYDDQRALELLLAVCEKTIRTTATFYANKYPDYLVEMEDLCQEGRIVVIEAAKKYDLNSGLYFTSTLYYPLMSAMDHALSISGPLVCTSRNFAAQYHKLQELYNEDRHLSTEESCQHLKVSETQLQLLSRYDQLFSHRNQLPTDFEAVLWEDQINPFPSALDQLIKLELACEVNTAMSLMTEREERVFRFMCNPDGTKKDYKEVAKHFGLRSFVIPIIEQKIKNKLNCRGLFKILRLNLYSGDYTEKQEGIYRRLLSPLQT